MKLKYIFFSVFMCLSFIGKAQFTVLHDTTYYPCIQYGNTTVVVADVTYTGTKKVVATWNVGSYNLPSGWSIGSICSLPGNCYPTPAVGVNYTSDTLSSGANLAFDVSYELTSNAAHGHGYVVLNVTDGSNAKTLVIDAYTCAPASVNELNNQNKFTVFYEKSSDQLVVILKDGINTANMEMYNILGAKISKNTMNNQTTRFNLNCPQGQYIIKLYDEKGNSLGVKRFMKTSD